MNLAQALASTEFDAFYTFNPQRLARAAAAFVEQFPGKVLYAVKANPLPEVIRTVRAQGVHGFDIASMAEADAVAAAAPGARCWFMNPSKSRRDIEHARRGFGIDDFVVDCQQELDKLIDVLPTNDPAIRVFVRFQLSGSDAVYELQSKFGASSELTARLIDDIGTRTRWAAGLAFHPGSQTMTVDPYLNALRMAEGLIKGSRTKISAVDIGGGFPGLYANLPPLTPWPMLAGIAAFVQASEVLRDVELLCEPGRAMTHDCMSLFARVILRKDTALHCGAGIFNGLLPAQQFLQLPVRAWRDGAVIGGEATEGFTVYGPTCDSADRLAFPHPLPPQIQEGDWVEFQSVGAYSESVRCAFNGFSVDHRIQVSDEELP